MSSKKDNETRGPFLIKLPYKDANLFITNGVIDFSISDDLLSLEKWPVIESAISTKMKSLGMEITELSKQRSQLGEALRASDPRRTEDEDTSGTSK